MGAAKPLTVKKDEDLYEMAIQYKKEEDFAGWYTDVSWIALATSSTEWLVEVHRDLQLTRVAGPDQRANARLLRHLWMLHPSSLVIHHLADYPESVAPSHQITSSWLSIRRRGQLKSCGPDRLVRRRDQEAGSTGLLLPDVCVES